MPGRCCVPGCKSNYDFNLNNVQNKRANSVFRFPKNEKRKLAWKRAIPRVDWEPSKYSVVCQLHFKPDDIIRYDKHLQPDGTYNQLLLSHPRLTQDAVPCIFTNLPSYYRLRRRREIENAATTLPTRTVFLPEPQKASTSRASDDTQEISTKLEDSLISIKPEPLELLPETVTAEVPVFNQNASTSRASDGAQEISIKLEDSLISIKPEPLELLPETVTEEASVFNTMGSNKGLKIYCRMCLKQTNELSATPLSAVNFNYSGKTEAYKKKKLEEVQEIQKMIHLCLPFFDSKTFNPVICSTCLCQLKTFYGFATKCLENQRKIEEYINVFGTTEKVVNINEFVESSIMTSTDQSRTYNTSAIPSISGTSRKRVSADNNPSKTTKQPRVCTNLQASERVLPSGDQADAQNLPDSSNGSSSKKRKTNKSEKEIINPDKETYIKEEPNEDDTPISTLSRPEIHRIPPNDSMRDVDHLTTETNYMVPPELIKDEPVDEMQVCEIETTGIDTEAATNCNNTYTSRIFGQKDPLDQINAPPEPDDHSEFFNSASGS